MRLLADIDLFARYITHKVMQHKMRSHPEAHNHQLKDGNIYIQQVFKTCCSRTPDGNFLQLVTTKKNRT